MNELKATNTLIENFIKNLDTNSIATRRTYDTALNKYVSYIQLNELDISSVETVKAYKQSLIANGYKVGTINSYLMAIKRLYSYLEDLGLCQNVAKNVKKLREANGFKKDSLTVDQVKNILNSIETSTLTGKRNKALMSLLVHTGLRTIEVNRACIGDIRNKGNKVVLYVQGKGHSEKDEYVYLSASVQNALNDYLKARKNINDNSPLFECTGNRATGTPLNTKSISRIVKGIFKQNGLVSERLTAHSTRHTACTIALLSGANLQEVQAMARHQNINTTMIYAHNLNRELNNAESKLASLID